MSVFNITGTIAAIGQSQFDNHATLLFQGATRSLWENS